MNRNKFAQDGDENSRREGNFRGGRRNNDNYITNRNNRNDSYNRDAGSYEYNNQRDRNYNRRDNKNQGRRDRSEGRNRRDFSSKFRSHDQTNEREEPYRLLIHNLPSNTDPEDLQEFLKDILGNIPIVGFKLFDSFAYFTVSSRLICNDAYKKLENESYRNNKLVLLKDKLSEEDIDSNDHWKMRVAEKRGSTLFTGRTRKVFVGNLPYNIKAWEVKKFFESKCGPIDDFRMSRGCCFIRFVNAKPSVHIALDYRNKELFGRKIRVEEELDDSDRGGKGRRAKMQDESKFQELEVAKHESNQKNNSEVDNVANAVDASSPNESDSENNSDGEEDMIDIENPEEGNSKKSRKGPKFLSEEELRKRKRYFEETEELFPKKKRRKKLIEKLEKEDTGAISYVNEYGEQSFIHKKKREKKIDMPIDELFVFEPPKKIIRNGVVEEINISIPQPDLQLVKEESQSMNAADTEDIQTELSVKEKLNRENTTGEGGNKDRKRNNQKDHFDDKVRNGKSNDTKEARRDWKGNKQEARFAKGKDTTGQTRFQERDEANKGRNTSKEERNRNKNHFEGRKNSGQDGRKENYKNEDKDEKLYSKKNQRKHNPHPDDIVEIVPSRTFKWSNQ